MALTKVTGQVVNTSTDLTVGVLTATTASFTGNVSVGGTLTYEDVTNVDSVGLITARNGIEVTDKGVQVGTGATVDSAADNTLTFLTNGSERVRIDSSGNFGINNTSPSSYLAGSRNLVIGAGSGAAGLTVRSSTSTDGFFAFADGTTGNETYRGYIAYGHSTDSLRFATSATERLRIDSSGNVGIGEDAPVSRLHLANSGSGSVVMTATNDTSGHTTGNGVEFGLGADEQAQIWNYENSYFRVATNNTERMRIDSSGQMGLGTASPDGTLHVHNGTAGSVTANGNADELIVESSGTGGISILTPDANHSYLIFGSPTSNEGAILRYRDSDNLFTIGTEDSNGALAFRSGAGSEAMRIDSLGRLLLGTTTAGSGDADDLTIANSGNTGITIRSGSSNGAAIYFSDGTSGAENYQGIVQYYHGTDQLQFYTNYAGDSNPRMVIDSSGRLMLGTTTTASLAFTVYSTENSAINFQNSNTGTGSANGFYVGTSTGTDAFVWNYENGALVFATNNTESMRIDNSGRLLVGSNTNLAPDGFASKIQTAGTDYQGGSISIRRDQNSASGPSLLFTKSRSTVVGGTTIVQDDDLVGQIAFYGADGGDVNQAAGYIRCFVDGTPGGNDMPGRLEFYTTADSAASPTQRMRIDSSGIVKINQSSTANIFRIQNTTSNESSMLIQNSTTGYNAGNGLYIGIGGDETSYFWAYQNENMTFATNNTARMTIFSGGKLRVPGVYAGTTTGGSAVHVESDGDMLRYTSSLKYKTDVETIEDARADAILNCRPVWYRSTCANDIKTEGSEKSDWGWYGFIAEEVAEIEPRLVNWATKDAVRQEDGTVESVERDPANYEAEGVRYDNFVPLLVNLAKRQQSTIEALEARIAALEG